MFAAWGLALAALTGSGVAAWRELRGLSVRRVARRLEDTGLSRQGSLTALLESPAPGTSESLYVQADRVQAEELGQRGGALVEPLTAPLRPVAAAGAVLLLAGSVALASAGPQRAPVAALWHPVHAWNAAVAPVRVAVDSAAIDRGDSVAFRVEAIGRRTATLWVRAPGEAWRARGLRLDTLGQATVWSGALQSDLYARVTSGGRGSDTILVRVRLRQPPARDQEDPGPVPRHSRPSRRRSR